MPFWLQPIASFIASIIGPTTARVLGALGVGAISLTGVQLTLNNVINLLKTSIGGVTANILDVITLCGFDVFLSLIISAYMGVISIRTLFGAFRRFGFMDLNGGDG
ncbi:DUF2523 family protein [Alcanivorax profundi]|uniref:DUF2523 family protein n=1 Tax=Alcanivorax profundi TaxID=2338368 RepID=UPI0032B1EBEA|tara:strand:- start:478 stop:795 length:318 start_codon:yes stop_codon:yes gene_type:complete